MSSSILENEATTIEALEADPIKPMRVFDLQVSAVQQLSKHFRRITFTGSDLDLFGSNAAGETLDLRVKIMIPSPGHALPEFSNIRGSLQDDWYQSWRTLDESVRGVMRTYTVRSLRRAVPASEQSPAVPAEMDIDFVLHLDGGSGPAAEWAAGALVGIPCCWLVPARDGETASVSSLHPATPNAFCSWGMRRQSLQLPPFWKPCRPISAVMPCWKSPRPRIS